MTHCQGKIPYPSKNEATVTIKALKGKGGPPLEAYLCQICGGFHVGHKAPKKRLRSMRSAGRAQQLS